MEGRSFRTFSIIKGLLLGCLGLVLIVKPGQMAAGIAFYVGLIMLAGGLVSFFYTYRLNKSGEFRSISYVAPVSVLVGSLILLVFPQYALSVFALVIGFWILMDGVSQIRISRQVNPSSKGIGRWLLVMGVISLIIGVLIVLRPYELIKMMTMLFGSLMLISGVFQVYSGLRR